MNGDAPNDDLNDDVTRKRIQDKLAKYEPPEEELEKLKHLPVVLLVGIVGAGKNTLLHYMLKHSDAYYDLVSHTTRQPRENSGILETEGVDYHFIDFKTAERMIDERQFVEVKIVHFKNLYGTTLEELHTAARQNKTAIADVEVQGVDEYVRHGMNAKPVFLLPPDFETWRHRLHKRYGDNVDKADLGRRLRTAQIELEYALATDYFYMRVNDELEPAAADVQAIIGDPQVERRPEAVLELAREILGQLNAELAADPELSAQNA